MNQRKPEFVARVHHNICATANCPHIKVLNYFDPYTACPAGHFGPYLQQLDNSAPVDTTPKAPASPKVASKTLNGPGTLLMEILKKLRIKPAPHCKCNPRAALMNTLGPDWCEQNIDTIVGWLKEEATRAKLPFLAPAARLLIRRAIRKSRALQAP